MLETIAAVTAGMGRREVIRTCDIPWGKLSNKLSGGHSIVRIEKINHSLEPQGDGAREVAIMHGGMRF